MNYLVVTLLNPKNNLNVFVYQKSRTEFKIKIKFLITHIVLIMYGANTN